MDRIGMMLSDSMKEAINLLHKTADEAQSGNEFLSGKKMGILSVISIIQNEAKSFGIELREISLPDEDIIELILKKYR